MTNPSYEYMRLIRREKQATLLDLRRERVVKALSGLTPHGGSHAMLSQIAYAIHPQVGSWDEGACIRLRNVLVELIGDAREAASDAQHVCACGAGGCDSGNEQTAALDKERQEAVSKLKDISVDALCDKYDYIDVYPEFMWAVGQAIGLRNGAGFEKIISRLIYLLGGDELTLREIGTKLSQASVEAMSSRADKSHDTSPMGLESETGNDDGTSITSELRKYVRNHETTTTLYAMLPMPPQLEKEPTPNGDKLLAIAGEIDERAEKLAHDVEMWRDRAEDMRMERDGACVERDKMQAVLGELERFDPDVAIEAFGDDNKELRRLLSRAAKLLASAERDRDENYHLWMDCKNKVLQSNVTIEELEEERDECYAECRMYRDMLNDAVGEYKALQDKLDLVLDACKSIN